MCVAYKLGYTTFGSDWGNACVMKHLLTNIGRLHGKMCVLIRKLVWHQK